MCASACQYGNNIDATTCCKTCDCAPPPITVCTSIGCGSNCAVYKVDPTTGCKTCDCATPVCDTLVACAISCAYGKTTNINGCENCICNPCPAVTCDKTSICTYGFKADASGCQVCDCNVDPPTTCDTGATPVSSTNSGTDAPDACNLKCTYGYIVEAGCIQCKCRAAPICDCGVRSTVTEKCLDGTVGEFTNRCVVSADNKCSYYYRKCPIGIVYNVTSGTFTSADLDNFLTTNRITLKDLNFTITTNPTTGKVDVVFFINPDALPAGTTDKSVADQIKSSSALVGNQGTAYVLSGTSQSTTATGFGNVVIVSVIGMLIALFM